MAIDPPLPNKGKFNYKPPANRNPVHDLPESIADETTQKSHRKVAESQEQAKFEKQSSGDVSTVHGAVSSKSDERTKDEDDKSVSSTNSENEYKEPWDPHSYYPISLPQRPPCSGDPDVFNAQEFGVEEEYDETKINSALELGLWPVANKKKKGMILFQFPGKLPLDQVPVSSKGKEEVGSSSSPKEDASDKCFGLNDLQDGRMGKMLVFKSGAIKLKIGDTIFNVSSGAPAGYSQSAAMDIELKACCALEKVHKLAAVTPDLNTISDKVKGMFDGSSSTKQKGDRDEIKSKGSVMFSKRLMPELITRTGGSECRSMSRLPPAFTIMLLDGFSRYTLNLCHTAMVNALEEARELCDLRERRPLPLEHYSLDELITCRKELITFMMGFVEDIQKMYQFLDDKHMAFIRGVQEQGIQLQNDDWASYLESHDSFRRRFWTCIDKVKWHDAQLVNVKFENKLEFFYYHIEPTVKLRAWLGDVVKIMSDLRATTIRWYAEL